MELKKMCHDDHHLHCDGDEEDVNRSPIRNFYKGRSILITGVTGFVGKVLLEKILRSFPDIGTIYILIRQKKGFSVQERMKQLLASQTFSFHFYPKSQLEKLVPVEGDICKPALGLSEDMIGIVSQSVSIVFHGAASIRFDSLLADHVKANVVGTKYLVTLCKQMTRLECLVCVSTAFSNCQLEEIEEKIYPLPNDPNEIIQLYQILDAETLETLVPKLIDGRPNTYVYSKALAEHIVCKEMKGITVAIARPAIVGPAVKDPIEGWVDSIHGPAGLSILAGLGILQTVDWQYDVKPDAIAVDFLSNGLIGSAWHMATHNPKQHKIFNMTSSNLRPMAAGDFMMYARRASIEYPSIYAMRPMMYPPKSRPSPIVYSLQKFFYHLIFAYLIDFMLVLVGRPRILVRIVNKMHRAIDIMQYFALREWKFESKNFLALIGELKGRDVTDFNPDLRVVKDEYPAIRNLWLGCRRFILREPDSNVTLARQKYVAVCFLYRVYQMMLLYFAWKIMYVWTPIFSVLLYVAKSVMMGLFHAPLHVTQLSYTLSEYLTNLVIFLIPSYYYAISNGDNSMEQITSLLINSTASLNTLDDTLSKVTT